MTIKQELQTLLNTKGEIRQAIIDKGVAVEENAPFDSYADKISQISGGSGGSSVAEYVYKNTTEEVNFPRQALTEGADNFFYSTSADQLDAMKAYLDKGNEVAYWGGYSNSWTVLQNSESWSGTPMNNTIIGFAFSKPVMPNFFHSRIGSTEWDLIATNDWDTFTTYLGGGASSELMTTLIASGENTNVTGGVDTPIGDGLSAYKYYVFKYMYSYSNIYNMALKVNTGNVTCTLKSPNMTPIFKCYPDEYMRVITQDWYNGSEIVPSKTLIAKPYEDGGCLVNYTDDGKAVNLKMFYMKSNGEKVGNIYNNFTVLGTLNIDDNTGIAKGFTNINKIELPIALSSDNWQFSIKANYQRVSRHQGLFYDKNLNRNFGEIRSTTQTMSSYIEDSWTDGTVALDNGADYWFLFDFRNGVLTSYVKKDDNYIDCPPKENMDINFTIQGLSSFSGHQIGLGNADDGEQWENTIDLSTAVLIENGVETWNAATKVALKDTYVLAPDDGFSLNGYESPLQAADLNIPAHSVPVAHSVKSGVRTE